MWQVTLTTELLNILVNNDSRKGDLLQKVILLRGYSLFQVIPFCKANFLQEVKL